MKKKPYLLRDTNKVEVFIPPHRPRVTTNLFRRTKQKLMAYASIMQWNIFREKGRCWICGKTEAELGQPLEAHHFGVERAFIDSPMRWEKVRQDFPMFNWEDFDPMKPEDFVDDMLAHGVLLCKEHHTGEGTGIHSLPFPLWVMQRYLPEGTHFSPTEVIDHSDT